MLVIRVKFPGLNKYEYTVPEGLDPQVGSFVIAETIRGVEYGEVIKGLHEYVEEENSHEIKQIIRMAADNDADTVRENKEKADRAFGICETKIAKHGLDMKLISSEYTFDRGKLLFYFSSEKRVDFRELVKDLASEFHTRIELRQIGVRDEARMLGGLGICGRPYCCSAFLDDFHPVSIKMAKEQNLSLNPVKISGTCGRLMCCLKYEQEAYEELYKNMLPQDSQVITPDGRGVIIEQNPIAGKVTVQLDSKGDRAIPSRVYHAKDVKPAPEGDSREYRKSKTKREFNQSDSKNS